MNNYEVTVLTFKEMSDGTGSYQLTESIQIKADSYEVTELERLHFSVGFSKTASFAPGHWRRVEKM